MLGSMKLCIVAAFLLAVVGRAAACESGPKCVCLSLGGKWLVPPKSFVQTCRITVEHQGKARYADVFFPKAISLGKQYPLWVHLHGLHTVAWWTGGKLDHPVRGGEAFYTTDKVTKGPLADQAIHVYPDASGDPNQRQFWNSLFWDCVQDQERQRQHCLDRRVDDVGFLEELMTKLLDDFPVDKSKVFMSGYSNGGMMIQTLLCQSTSLPSKLTAVALVKSGMKKKFMDNACPGASGLKVPMVILAGTDDRTFLYNNEGRNGMDAFSLGPGFYSSVNFADAWQRKRGCLGSPPKDAASLRRAAGPTVTQSYHYFCKSLCDSKPREPLWWCPMLKGAHSYNSPRQGLENDIVWSFFSKVAEGELFTRNTPVNTFAAGGATSLTPGGQDANVPQDTAGSSPKGTNAAPAGGDAAAGSASTKQPLPSGSSGAAVPAPATMPNNSMPANSRNGCSGSGCAPNVAPPRKPSDSKQVFTEAAAAGSEAPKQQQKPQQQGPPGGGSEKDPVPVDMQLHNLQGPRG